MISLREYEPIRSYDFAGKLKNLTATVTIHLDPPTTLDEFAFLYGILRKKGESEVAFKARFYAFCDANGIVRPVIP